MNKEERLQLEEELLMTCSKAQAINKYIDELEENSKLSELWCKSQEENQKYKEVFDKVNKIIMQPNIEIREYHSCDMDYIYVNEQLLDILKEVE